MPSKKVEAEPTLPTGVEPDPEASKKLQQIMPSPQEAVKVLPETKELELPQGQEVIFVWVQKDLAAKAAFLTQIHMLGVLIGDTFEGWAKNALSVDQKVNVPEQKGMWPKELILGILRSTHGMTASMEQRAQSLAKMSDLKRVDVPTILRKLEEGKAVRFVFLDEAEMAMEEGIGKYRVLGETMVSRGLTDKQKAEQAERLQYRMDDVEIARLVKWTEEHVMPALARAAEKFPVIHQKFNRLLHLIKITVARIYASNEKRLATLEKSGLHLNETMRYSHVYLPMSKKIVTEGAVEAPERTDMAATVEMTPEMTQAFEEYLNALEDVLFADGDEMKVHMAQFESILDELKREVQPITAALNEFVGAEPQGGGVQ